jgi:hypothetical protein
MDMAQTKFGSWGFWHFSMEIIGMINNEYPNVFGQMMLMMILILMNVISCNMEQ